jgi:hypothetical protein
LREMKMNQLMPTLVATRATLPSTVQAILPAA